MEFNEQFIEVLKESIHEAFSTTLSLEPKLVGVGNPAANPEGLICSIGFAGTIDGSIVINVSQKVACKFVSKMLGMDIEEMSNDVADGTGEILNMIAGGVKKRLGKFSHTFDISLPTSVKGHELEIAMRQGMEPVKMQYACAEDAFDIMAFYKIHQEGEEVRQVVKKSAVDAKTLLNAVMGEEAAAKPDAGDPVKQEAGAVAKQNMESAGEDDFLKDVAAVVSQAEEVMKPVSPNADAFAATKPTEGQEKTDPFAALQAVVGNTAASEKPAEPVAASVSDTPVSEGKADPFAALQAAVGTGAEMVKPSEPAAQDIKASAEAAPSAPQAAADPFAALQAAVGAGAEAVKPAEPAAQDIKAPAEAASSASQAAADPFAALQAAATNDAQPAVEAGSSDTVVSSPAAGIPEEAVTVPPETPAAAETGDVLSDAMRRLDKILQDYKKAGT